MDSVVDYIIRPLYPEEIHLLRDFLYEAIFIPEGVEPLPRDVVDLPELKLYIQDFGKKQDDCCLVVEYDGKVVGAVWTRIMNDYGHVDDETPSLSISLYKEYRNKGMGRQLMKEMMKLLESKGYHHVSLSVQKANYAVRMYLKLGFTIMKETEEEFIMVRDITKEASNYQRFLSGEYCNRLDSEVLNMIMNSYQCLIISPCQKKKELHCLFACWAKSDNIPVLVEILLVSVVNIFLLVKKQSSMTIVR